MDKETQDRRLRELGERLRVIREDQGLTQLDLAVKCGLDRSQIGRIERGAINTTVRTLLIISEALEMDIKEFFGEVSNG